MLSDCRLPEHEPARLRVPRGVLRSRETQATNQRACGSEYAADQTGARADEGHKTPHDVLVLGEIVAADRAKICVDWTHSRLRLWRWRTAAYGWLSVDS